MTGLHLKLPSTDERLLSFPHAAHLPPPQGRKLPNGTILVTDEARPDLLWKFTPWEKTELAACELEIYAELQSLPDPSTIVQLLGVGGTAVHLVRLLERAPGDTLERFLRNGHSDPARPSPEVTHSILVQIARAMEGLHMLDVVHRDLKAENVLVFGPDAEHHVRVKLADFDRSVKLARGKQLSEPAGSLWHMAPELLDHRPYDRRIDIYAFGMLLFEVTHGGARPYPNVATGLPGSMSAAEFADSVVRENLRPEWRWDDPLLSELFTRCTASDPAARPEFSEILEILSPSASRTRPAPATIPPKVPAMIGLASTIGRVRQSMEDAICVLDLGDLQILAVFDGLRGARSSSFAAHHLALALAHGLETAPVQDAIEGAFRSVQLRLRRLDPKLTCGTTATLAVIDREAIHVAWVGDSPAWLLRATSTECLANAHLPTRSDEVRRIVSVEGRIRREEREMDSGEKIPWGPLRVYAQDGSGGIVLSRALGLPGLGPAIGSDPEITRLPRHGREEFLILASDGVFEVCNIDQVKAICAGSASMQAAAEGIIAAVLTAGAPDNASVIVADLGEN